MAQQLYTQGQTVELLALVDAWAPDPADQNQPDAMVTVLASFAQDLGLSLEHFKLPWEDILALEPEAQLAYVLDQAREANLVPPEIDLDQIRWLLHIFKTNLQAMERYTPRPYPGRLILYRADETWEATGPDAQRGWDDLALGGVEVHTVPGDHFTLIRQPHVQTLAERLRAYLDEAPIVRDGEDHAVA